jgi:hypothetical protein
MAVVGAVEGRAGVVAVGAGDGGSGVGGQRDRFGPGRGGAGEQGQGDRADQPGGHALYRADGEPDPAGYLLV